MGFGGEGLVLLYFALLIKELVENSGLNVRFGEGSTLPEGPLAYDSLHKLSLAFSLWVSGSLFPLSNAGIIVYSWHCTQAGKDASS